MPELLHEIPALDDTPRNRVDNPMGPVHFPSVVSDAKIKGFSDLLITDGPCCLVALIARVGDEGGDIKGGFRIAGIAHLGVARSIVNHHYVGIEIH